MKMTFNLARSKLQETDEKTSYNKRLLCKKNSVSTKT